MFSSPHLVIVGLMGVGKSTLGSAYAQAHNLRYVDSDDDIERLFAATGGELATRWGVDELHSIEAGVLLGALASTTRSVITAAASVVENAAARDALQRRATVVWLRGDIDETLKRQAEGGHRRPMERDELAALAERRAPMFDGLADIQLDAMHWPGELVAAIDTHLNPSSPEPERIKK